MTSFRLSRIPHGRFRSSQYLFEFVGRLIVGIDIWAIVGQVFFPLGSSNWLVATKMFVITVSKDEIIFIMSGSMNRDE